MSMPGGRRKLPQVAAEQIKELIEHRQLQPGDMLPTERELTQRLNISRGPVREALRTLEALGLIEIKPGRGTFYRGVQSGRGDAKSSALSGSDIDDLLEVRAMLETRACMLAAQRRTPEDIAEMEATISDARQAIDRGDWAALVLADAAFHHVITRATGNKLLIRLEAALAHQMTIYWRANLSVEGMPAAALERHQRLLEAISARDADWAASVMLGHMRALESRGHPHVARVLPPQINLGQSAPYEAARARAPQGIDSPTISVEPKDSA